MTLQEQYEKQKEINKELVDENEALKFAARMSEKTEKQLRAEIEEFKETNHELAELAIERQKEIDELENKLENIRYYLDNEIPHELINEATTIIYKMV